jgi:hypothetical protein
VSRLLVTLLLAGVAGSAVPSAAPAADVAAGCFAVLDAMLHAGKPDLRAEGLAPLPVVEPERWWSAAGAADEAARRAATVRAIRDLHPVPARLVLDLELADGRDPVRRKQNVERYTRLIAWVRDAGFNGSLGYYGLAPPRDYWRAVGTAGAAGVAEWQTENEAYRRLASLVDAEYPSLYTFYPDRDGWRRYALANLAEARRLAPGKAVIAFLWPQYHGSNRELADRDLETDFWAEELETVYAAADGLVVWGGWDFVRGAPRRWDPRAPWWLALQDFIRRHPRVCRPGT